MKVVVRAVRSTCLEEASSRSALETEVRRARKALAAAGPPAPLQVHVVLPCVEAETRHAALGAKPPAVPTRHTGRSDRLGHTKAMRPDLGHAVGVVSLPPWRFGQAMARTWPAVHERLPLVDGYDTYVVGAVWRSVAVTVPGIDESRLEVVTLLATAARLRVRVRAKNAPAPCEKAWV